MAHGFKFLTWMLAADMIAAFVTGAMAFSAPALNLAHGEFFANQPDTPLIAPVQAVLTMVGLLLPHLSMDSEIKEEFAAVRAELRTVADHVREVDAHVRDLDARVRDVDTRLTEVDTRLSAKIHDEGVTTRRHFDVVAESLRDGIRIIAEGFVALDAKVERIRDSR